MNKVELDAFANKLIYEKPKIYKYLKEKVDSKISSFDVFSSYLFKDKCYCPICKKVVLTSYNNKLLKESPIVNCSLCDKSIKVERLSNRIRTERNNRYIFDILELKNNCLINQTYCISYDYSFRNGEYNLEQDLFKLCTEVYDLESNLKSFKLMNVYLDGWGHRHIYHFGNSWAKNCNSSFDELLIYYKKSEDINFLKFILMENSVKTRFFKYIDTNFFKEDFVYNYRLVPFIRTLNIYPNLETLYKLENYVWSNRKSDFFRSVLDCLKKRKGYEKYNYHLFHQIYTCGLGAKDFNFYNVNIRLGKPYLRDSKLIDYLWDHKKYITREYVNYFLKQPYNLYNDYIEMIEFLKMDLEDIKVKFPKNLKQAHDDLVVRINKEKESINNVKFLVLKEKYSLLEFEENGYSFYLPTSSTAFKKRGNYLKQCLFSSNYDKRYLEGRSIIVFINSLSDYSRKNMFTLELNNKLSIVQLHGFGNDLNCSEEQTKNLSIVREIITKRLELLEMEKGKVVYKNIIFHSSGKKEGVNAP